MYKGFWDVLILSQFNTSARKILFGILYKDRWGPLSIHHCQFSSISVDYMHLGLIKVSLKDLPYVFHFRWNVAQVSLIKLDVLYLQINEWLFIWKISALNWLQRIETILQYVCFSCENPNLVWSSTLIHSWGTLSPGIKINILI